MKLDNMKIYNDAIELAVKFRYVFNSMDKADQFSIGQQMLRSSVSISSNIAEGVGRDASSATLLQFLGYSRGSLYEFRTQLKIVERIYRTLSKDSIYELNDLCVQIEDGIKRFILSIEKKSLKSSPKADLAKRGSHPEGCVFPAS